jgi:hypothetical protein
MHERKCTLNKIIIPILAALLLCPASYAGEQKNSSPLGRISILKTSSEDRTAVVKTLDGKMLIVNAGDVLLIENNTVRIMGRKKDEQPTTPFGKAGQLTITEIAKDRVVIEENTGSGIDTVIISVHNGKQTSQRISKTGGEPRVLLAPKTGIVDGEKN